MGGLLTVPAFLDRFPQVDTISNNSAQNARIQGKLMRNEAATMILGRSDNLRCRRGSLELGMFRLGHSHHIPWRLSG